jgi:hypothetical protein
VVVRFVVDDELLVAPAVLAAVVVSLKRLLASMLPLHGAQPRPVVLARVAVVLATCHETAGRE